MGTKTAKFFSVFPADFHWPADSSRGAFNARPLRAVNINQIDVFPPIKYNYRPANAAYAAQNRPNYLRQFQL